MADPDPHMYQNEMDPKHWDNQNLFCRRLKGTVNLISSDTLFQEWHLWFTGNYVNSPFKQLIFHYDFVQEVYRRYGGWGWRATWKWFSLEEIFLETCWGKFWQSLCINIKGICFDLFKNHPSPSLTIIYNYSLGTKRCPGF